MVDPAFEKMPAETVTMRMCLYSRVRSISDTIFAKHFSPSGEQKSPFCERPFTSGSMQNATCASAMRPSFSSLSSTSPATLPVCTPQKVSSTAGIEISRSSSSRSAAVKPSLAIEKPSESTPELRSFNASALASFGHSTATV